MSPFFLSLIVSFSIGLISYLGLFFASKKFSGLARLTPYLVSLAVGTLLGDAFIHLLPQAFEILPSSASGLTLSGLFLFFFIEKIFRWRHCHNVDCDDSRSHLAALNLAGDLVHNFIDGLLIAASFQVSLPLGITTSLAIMAHEIPQEIGDFGIMVHSGLPPSKALRLNFLVSLSSVFGTLLFFILGKSITGLSDFLIPVTAGGFIYLASSDLIPELHRHTPRLSDSARQLAFIFIGLAFMYLLVFLE
ncbi:MAG: ZIP family metal transporter [Candidatus Shapirobacteria bacterium]|jgi:zinc and cadmium transporter